MDRHERIDEQLANVPLFSGLSKKELRLISQLATYLEEPAGTVLTEEGKAGHEFIIVLDGEIEVRQGGRVVAERGAGSYIGEIALLDHRPRTATVVAKTPVAIEVIGQREFAGLLAEVPELSQQLLATVARRLADLDQSGSRRLTRGRSSDRRLKPILRRREGSPAGGCCHEPRRNDDRHRVGAATCSSTAAS